MVLNLNRDSNDKFILHTFGYGDDHDPELMRDLAARRSGTFYYIRDLERTAEFFADALGGLGTVALNELRFDLSGDNIAFTRLYGSGWEDNSLLLK